MRGHLSCREYDGKIVIFLFVFLLLSFIILLQFSILSIIIGLLSLPIIVLYPLMKRITKNVDIVFHCAATAYEGLSVFSPNIVTKNKSGNEVWTYDKVGSSQSSSSGVSATYGQAQLNQGFWAFLFGGTSLLSCP